MAARLKKSGKGRDSKEFRTSHACIIGINDYGNGVPPLTTPVNDATHLAKLLKEEHGYAVHLLVEDVTKARIEAFFIELLRPQVGANDRLLLYFAGHGVALDGDDGPRGYLVPQDARSDDSDSLLAMTDLHAWLDALQCRHMLAILDCCFAGAFRWASTRHLSTAGLEVIHKERYERFLRSPAWQVLTSAAYDQRALDVVAGKAVGSRGIREEAGERHSPFALALYEALRGEGDLIPKGQGDGVITATELYLYLREQVEVGVEEDVGHEQTPGLWPLSKHDRGEYVFLTPGHELNLPPAPELTLDLNPWRGLNSYDQKHSELFFGRDQEIEGLSARVGEQPFTAVLGASGTGKSSLVKAGLLPHLGRRGEERDGGAGNGSAWFILPPLRPGATPLLNLHRLLAALLTDQPDEMTLATLRDDPQALADLIAAWGQANPNNKLLLVVDQLEELVTLCQEEAREHFLRLLAQAIAHQPDAFRLIITLRTDFEPQFDANTALAPFWQAARYVVPPMDQADLRQIIEGPASVRVLYFEPPELVEVLITEVIQTPGALPLLSFTLSELYIRYLRSERGNRALAQEDYDDLGGVIGSLRNRANEEYEALPDDACRETMQRVMLRMISVEGGELARRRVQRSELVYPDERENRRVKTVLDRLVEARLLVTGQEEGDVYVEPAHDALVLAWDKLLRWKREAEQYLPLQRRLAQAAMEWTQASQDTRSGLLWDDDPRLLQLEETLWPAGGKAEGLRGRMRWVRQVLVPNTDTPPNTKWLNDVEVAFVQASVRARAKFWRLTTGITTAVIIVLAALTIFATVQANIATARQAEAERQARVTLAQSLAALSSTANDDLSETDVDVNLLLALEALQLHHENGGSVEWLADQNLRQVLKKPDLRRIWVNGHMASVDAVAYSPDGRQIASGSFDKTVRVWDVGRPAAEPLILMGHTAGVNAVAFSPDGTLIASGSGDETVRVWDLANPGAEPQVLRGHTDWVNAVAFSPDGRQVASGSSDRTVRVWELADPGAEPLVLRGHDDDVNAVAYSPDGRRIASGSADETVRVWDVADPEAKPLVLRGHDDDVNAVAFSPDGRKIASGSADETVRVWELADPRTEPLVLRGQSDWVNAVAYSPDGGHVAFGSSDRTVRVWDVADPDAEPLVFGGHTDGVNSVVYSPNGRQIASGSDDETVRVWDLADREAKPLVLRGHTGGVNAVAYSPDGMQIVSGSSDGTVRVWDLEDPGAEPLVLSGQTDGVNAVAYSPDGRRVASGSSDGTVRVWDLAHPGAEPLVLRGHTDGVNAVAYSPDGMQIASGSDDETVRVWELTNPGAEPAVLRGHTDGVNAVAFSPDGTQIVSGSDDQTVRVWELAHPGAEPLVLRGHTDGVNSVTFSPDGRQIASGSDDQMVRVWDHTDAGGELLVLSGHVDSVNSVAYSPDGMQIASGSDDQTVRVWGLANREAEPLVLRGNAVNVFSVAYSPGGRRVASGSSDGTVRVWELADPEAEPLLLSGHVDSVNGVAFSPDGTQIASGSSDGAVRVWELADPEAEPLLLSGHVDSVNGVAFSPDGWRVASGSSDGMVRVWELAHPEAEPLVLSGHADGVNGVAFSPEGTQIVSGSRDQTVRVWELADPGADPLVMRGHTDPVLSVSFSPDGTQVASGSGDQTVRVWELADPRAEPLVLRGHTASVFSVAFSPDGTQVASGSSDMTVRIWDLADPGVDPLVLSGYTDPVWSVAFSPDGRHIASGSGDQTLRLWPTLRRLSELACQQVSRKGLTEAEWNRYAGDVIPWRTAGQCDRARGVPVWWENMDH